MRSEAPSSINSSPRVRSFFESRGSDTLAPDWEDMAVLYGYEEVIEMDPFEAQFDFTVDGDALILTVDDDLAITERTV